MQSTKILPEVPLQRKGPATAPVAPDNTLLLNESIKASIAITALLDEQSKLLRRQIYLQELQIPKGITYPMSFTIAYTAGSMVHLNFVTGEKDQRGIAATSPLAYPYAKLFSLIIYNDGTGDIAVTTNVAQNSSDASAIVKSGTNITIEFSYPVIESLNISLAPTSTSNAVVRLIGLA